MTLRISVDTPRGASSNLVARKLNTSRRILCAAPDYLHERGKPETPDDLAAHDCLSYSYLSAPNEWHLAGADGEHMVKVKGPIVTSHRHVLRSAALLGIAYGPVDFFRDDIAAPASCRSCPTMNCRRRRFTRVYPATRRLSAGESLQRFHGSLLRG